MKKQKQKVEDKEQQKTLPLCMRMSTKNEVVRFEKDNFDKVVLMPSGQFWNATEHSAFFMIKVLGSKARVHVLYDNYIKRERVFVSYNAQQAAVVKAEAMKKYEILRDDPSIFMFSLKKKIEPAQIKEWQKDEDLKQQKLDAYFMPDSGETRLYTLLRSLGRETFIADDRMRQGARDILGQRLMDLVMAMYREYAKLCSKAEAGIEEKMSVVGRIKELAGEFSFLIMIAVDEKLIVDERRMMRMGMTLKDIIKELRHTGGKNKKSRDN